MTIEQYLTAPTEGGLWTLAAAGRVLGEYRDSLQMLQY